MKIELIKEMAQIMISFVFDANKGYIIIKHCDIIEIKYNINNFNIIYFKSN